MTGLPDGTNEEYGLLGNDGQLAPQVIQANLCNIDPINDYRASTELHKPEQSYSQGGLPCKHT